MSRWAGLYVAPGNPHQIQGWTDLTKPGLRFVNREKGAGLSGYDLSQTGKIMMRM